MIKPQTRDWSCKPERLGEGWKIGKRGVENRKIPKVVRRGCQRSFEPRECKTGLHMVQQTLGRPLHPGSKRPFAPSPNHFRGGCCFFAYNWKLPAYS